MCCSRCLEGPVPAAFSVSPPWCPKGLSIKSSPEKACLVDRLTKPSIDAVPAPHLLTMVVGNCLKAFVLKDLSQTFSAHEGPNSFLWNG